MNTNHKARTDDLIEAHAHLRRIFDGLTKIAHNAHRRNDKTTANHALDALEQLAELVKNHNRQTRALLHEIQNNQPQERPNK